jgi:hypothetical protein
MENNSKNKVFMAYFGKHSLLFSGKYWFLFFKVWQVSP